MSIFSDCLNIEFIDILNRIIKELKGKFTYDHKGVKTIFDIILTDLEILENELYLRYTEEMREVFINQI